MLLFVFAVGILLVFHDPLDCYALLTYDRFFVYIKCVKVIVEFAIKDDEFVLNLSFTFVNLSTVLVFSVLDVDL